VTRRITLLLRCVLVDLRPLRILLQPTSGVVLRPARPCLKLRTVERAAYGGSGLGLCSKVVE